MKSLLLKLDTAVYTQWKEAAQADKLNVSEWIRYQCNNAIVGVQIVQEIELSQPERAGRNNGSANDENLPRVSDREVSGRRTVASERRDRPRGKGKLRAIKDVANKAFRNRNTSRGNRTANGARVAETLSGEGVGAHPSVVAAGTALVVTRDNFAEVAASISKDELDVWARSLPSDILPKHSATSNRHTCLCSFCLTWRKANYIPYGGPGEKKKSRFAK